MRNAAIPHLAESDLRSFLEKLRERSNELLAAPARTPPGGTVALAASHVREAVALLAIMSCVLSAVGEVHAAEARALRDTVHRLLIGSAAPVSYEAAAVLGQLAAVEDSNAAKLMLDYLSLVQLQAASLGSQSGSRHGAGVPVLPASASGARAASCWSVMLLQEACSKVLRSDRFCIQRAAKHMQTMTCQRGSAPHASWKVACWPPARSWAQ